jgi:hypothetical protein
MMLVDRNNKELKEDDLVIDHLFDPRLVSRIKNVNNTGDGLIHLSVLFQKYSYILMNNSEKYERLQILSEEEAIIHILKNS